MLYLRNMNATNPGKMNAKRYSNVARIALVPGFVRQGGAIVSVSTVAPSAIPASVRAAAMGISIVRTAPPVAGRTCAAIPAHVTRSLRAMVASNPALRAKLGL